VDSVHIDRWLTTHDRDGASIALTTFSQSVDLLTRRRPGCTSHDKYGQQYDSSFLAFSAKTQLNLGPASAVIRCNASSLAGVRLFKGDLIQPIPEAQFVAVTAGRSHFDARKGAVGA